MVMNIILLILGFFILIKASDIFVDSVSSIAINLKVPKIVIALTIASFGTCAPELAISFNSIFTGNGDVALANVIGSNIVNILLIIGIAATIFPIKVKHETIKKQLPLLLLITSTFSMILIGNILLKSKNILHWYDGLLLILLFVIFIFYIISISKHKKEETKEKPKYGVVKSLMFSLLCILAIIISSDLVVDSAIYIAKSFNISQKVITMTIIVIGTSLPELITTIIAAKKGEFDLAIGNIIGTNIFNIGVVLGLPIILHRGVASTAFNIVDILIVELAALILFLFAKNDRILTKREGILMTLVFVIYYLYMIFV